MRKLIFDFRDYKSYLVARLQESPKGSRTRLAKALRVHNTFISQVLGGRSDFSLEQADVINAYLHHSDEESEFFLLLVQWARAGTDSLRSRFERKLSEFLNARNEIKNRLDFSKSIETTNQTLYYSSWMYAAIHMLLGVPSFQSKSAVKIAKRLNLNVTIVNQVLRFLESAGLAARSLEGEENVIQLGASHVHLDRSSPMIGRHLSNWRIEALKSVDRNVPEDLHYSSVVTMAQKDFERVRKTLLEAIDNVLGQVRQSEPSEDLYCFSTDWFRV